MKRTFDQIDTNPQQNGVAEEQQETAKSSLYDQGHKIKKLQNQRVGNFIVKSNEAIHFRVFDESNPTSGFFSPLMTHQVFGEQEQIQGYEGLSIDITLSPKYLRPLVNVRYEKKAPSFAKIDDIEAILRDHYGVIYTDAQEFQEKVINEEKQIPKFGQKIAEVGSSFDLHKVCMNEGLGEDGQKDFSAHQHYLQTILLFFIDGASKIDVDKFWHYFILYDKSTGNVAGFTTIFEAHRNANMFRSKLAQIFIVPAYQGKGLGSKLYEAVYKYYLDNPKCFELIVEDANDTFQRVQDVINTKYLLQKAPEFHKYLLGAECRSFISQPDHLNKAFNFLKQPEKPFKDLQAVLKLPTSVLQRLIDMIIYSKLEIQGCNPKIHNVYRLAVKRRLYIRSMKIYHELFKGSKEVLQGRQMKKKKEAEPQINGGQIMEGGKAADSGQFLTYQWNSLMKNDEFGLKSLKDLKEEAKEQNSQGGQGQAKTALGSDLGGDLMTQEAIKIQLKNLYQDMAEDFKKIKDRIKQTINDDSCNGKS